MLCTDYIQLPVPMNKSPNFSLLQVVKKTRAPIHVRQSDVGSWYLYKHGHSETGVRVWSEIGYLTCLRHLFRSRVATIKIEFFSLKKRYFFLHTCASCSKLPSNISTMPNIIPHYKDHAKYMVF